MEQNLGSTTQPANCSNHGGNGRDGSRGANQDVCSKHSSRSSSQSDLSVYSWRRNSKVTSASPSPCLSAWSISSSSSLDSAPSPKSIPSANIDNARELKATVSSRSVSPPLPAATTTIRHKSSSLSLSSPGPTTRGRAPSLFQRLARLVTTSGTAAPSYNYASLHASEADAAMDEDDEDDRLAAAASTMSGRADNHRQPDQDAATDVSAEMDSSSSSSGWPLRFKSIAGSDDRGCSRAMPVWVGTCGPAAVRYSAVLDSEFAADVEDDVDLPVASEETNQWAAELSEPWRRVSPQTVKW